MPASPLTTLGACSHIHISQSRETDPAKAVALLDGANFSSLMRSLRARMSFDRLGRFISTRYHVSDARYYTAVFPGSSVERLIDEAERAGWRSVRKLIRESEKHQKGDMKARIGADLVAFAAGHTPLGPVSTVVLLSGDSDYAPIVSDYLKPYGVRLVVVGSLLDDVNGRLSRKLFEQADEFVEVAHILPEIALAA